MRTLRLQLRLPVARCPSDGIPAGREVKSCAAPKAEPRRTAANGQALNVRWDKGPETPESESKTHTWGTELDDGDDGAPMLAAEGVAESIAPSAFPAAAGLVV